MDRETGFQAEQSDGELGPEEIQVLEEIERSILRRYFETSEGAYAQATLAKIFGPDLSEHIKMVYAQVFAKAREEGMQAFPAEIEKGAEFLRYVQLVNDFLNQEFKALGLDKISSLKPEQYHLLPEIMEDQSGALGRSLAMAETIELDGPLLIRSGALNAIKVMLHEAIHANAFERLKVKDPKQVSVRSGYSFVHNLEVMGVDISSKSLVALNEAVVESLARELLAKHRPELDQEFNLTQADWDNLLPAYEVEVRGLAILLRDIAKAKGKSVAEVWLKYKKGEFTGEMIHLKDLLKLSKAAQ